MPQIGFTQAKYKPPRESQAIWDNFRGGLNVLFPQTEVAKNELPQMDNMYLIGRGVPKKRGGLANFFLTAASVATNSQIVRGLRGVKFASGASGVLELLSISDAGYLVRQNGASYTIMPGFSYSSGYDANMVQLSNKVYVANGQDIFTRYNGVTITSFTSIGLPVSLTATLYSGATGDHTYNWLVTASNDVGETVATALASLAGLPIGVASANVRIAWSPASPSSLIQRYNIYGREIGFGTFLAGTDSTSNQFIDNGTLNPSLLGLPPLINTTGGPIFKYLISSKDKLFGANAPTNQSRLFWSGGGLNIDKFHWSVGGGFVDISPDDGDVITGIVDAFNSVVVFKQNSIWQVTLKVEGSIVIPLVVLITRAIGCVAPKSIKYVENDIFYLSNRGIFGLGYEPNILSVLRTTEISVKVRPVFQSLNAAQSSKAASVYHNNKYRVSYPDVSASYNNKEIWYDRERLAWVGPQSYPAAPNTYEIFRDGANAEHLLWGDSNDNFVTEYSTGFATDKGGIIPTVLLTKKEVFDDPFMFKRIKDLFMNWRNIAGSLNVTILIEDRTGTVNVANSFTITAAGSGIGWGMDKWGTQKWGTSAGAGSSASSVDLARWIKLLKIARNIQVQITTTGVSDTYELLNLKFNYHFIGQSYIPTSWRV